MKHSVQLRQPRYIYFILSNRNGIRKILLKKEFFIANVFFLFVFFWIINHIIKSAVSEAIKTKGISHKLHSRKTQPSSFGNKLFDLITNPLKLFIVDFRRPNKYFFTDLLIVLVQVAGIWILFSSDKFGNS